MARCVNVTVFQLELRHDTAYLDVYLSHVRNIRKRTSNPCNLVNFPVTNHETTQTEIPRHFNTIVSKNSKASHVPAFFLSNVMSLAPKIDEVREVFRRRGKFQFISIVETWLHNHIHDNVVNLQGYSLIRKDRTSGQHGGVCMYIEDAIDFERLDEISNDLFEVLWINMRMSRLPR
jgi:hypothetical protein